MFKEKHIRMLSVFRVQVALLAFAFATGGCKESSYGPPPNQKPIEMEGEQTTATAESKVQAASLDADSFAALLLNDPSFEVTDSQIVEPLQKYLLSTPILNGSEDSSRTGFLNLTHQYHKALLRLIKLSPDDPRIKPRLDAYDRAVLKPCYSDPNNCQAFRQMAKDSLYSEVVLNVSERVVTDGDRQWSYTFFAQDFAKRLHLSAEAKNLMLSSFERQMKALKFDGSSQSKARTLEIGQRFENLLQLVPPHDPDTMAMLDRIDVFNRSGDQPLDVTLHQSLQAALWPKLIRDWGMKEDGQLMSSFSKWLNQSLEQFEKSTLADFDTTIGKRIWKTFRLEDPRTDAREITFLVDQSSRSIIDEDQALYLMARLNVQPSQLIDVVRKYVQLRFAQLTIKTNTDLSKVLGQRDGYRTVEDVFTILMGANRNEIEWAGFVRELEILRGITKGRLDDLRVNYDDPLRKVVQETFEMLPKEILWNITYPTMLPVMYYISTSHLTQPIRTRWGGYLTLTSDLIMAGLFDGTMPTLFNFINSSEPQGAMTPPEVLMAFRNALNSELFSSYQQVTAELTPSRFLLELINRTLTTASADLDFYSQGLYRDLFIDTQNRRDMDAAPSALEVSKFCRNEDRSKENIQLGAMDKGLIGYQDAMTSPNSPVNIFTHLPTAPAAVTSGSALSRYTYYTFLDYRRTTDFYRLEWIEKMRDIYAAYLKFHGLEDDGILEVNRQLDEIRDKLRRFVGLMYYGYHRHNECILEILDLGQHRQIEAMKYEMVYLKQVYRDLESIRANPTLLTTVNARYRKFVPEMKEYSKDQFEISNKGVEFLYSKADHRLRLRDFLKTGYTDASGVKYPAIAPDLDVKIPSDPLNSGYGYRYEYFYDGSNVLRISDQSGGEEKFLKTAMSVFFNSSIYDTVGGVRTTPMFVGWYDSYTAGLGIRRMVGHNRFMFEASLIKLGPIDAYDFEREGCSAQASLEELNKNCRAHMEILPTELIEMQKQLYKRISIRPEFEQIFKWTAMSAVYGGFRDWEQFLMSPLDGKPMGLIDPYRFIGARNAVADNILWPGEVAQVSYKASIRLGRLEIAKVYADVFGVSEGKLFDVDPAVNAELRKFYRGYAEQDFAFPRALEAAGAAEWEKTQRPIEIPLEIGAPPIQIPMATTYELDSPPVREFKFHRDTKFIFKDNTAN